MTGARWTGATADAATGAGPPARDLVNAAYPESWQGIIVHEAVHVAHAQYCNRQTREGPPRPLVLALWRLYKGYRGPFAQYEPVCVRPVFNFGNSWAATQARHAALPQPARSAYAPFGNTCAPRHPLPSPAENDRQALRLTGLAHQPARHAAARPSALRHPCPARPPPCSRHLRPTAPYSADFSTISPCLPALLHNPAGPAAAIHIPGRRSTMLRHVPACFGAAPGRPRESPA